MWIGKTRQSVAERPTDNAATLVCETASARAGDVHLLSSSTSLCVHLNTLWLMTCYEDYKTMT